MRLFRNINKNIKINTALKKIEELPQLEENAPEKIETPHHFDTHNFKKIFNSTLKICTAAKPFCRFIANLFLS